MGEKLTRIFELATKEFGGVGRVKLALFTKTSSALAGAVQDSPDKVVFFERALERLRAEHEGERVHEIGNSDLEKVARQLKRPIRFGK